jgi:hypothetical protein
VPALPSLWGGQDIVSSHRRRYTRSTFTEAFARAGLPAPRATYFNIFLFPAVAAVRWGAVRWVKRTASRATSTP